MVVDRAPLGLLIAALGAAVLAVSVFAPWYGLSITASGAVAARQELSYVAEQYGNAAFQTRANGIEAQFDALTGRQLATVSAHQTMKHVSTILLVLAGIALLASLLRLADLRGLLYATGGQIALAGVIAAGIVIFRLYWHPDRAVGFISLSPIWGIWLALVSSAVVVAGGMVAGSGRSRLRETQKRGPGPPPIGRNVTSPLAIFRQR